MKLILIKKILLGLILVFMLSSCAFLSSDYESPYKALDKDNLYNSDLDYGTFVDNRDGRVYKTIKIGDQIWLAENFAYLPKVNFENEYSKELPMYYVYNYSGNTVSEAKQLDNYDNYGVLYNFSAAVEACPEGWHLPSVYEWEKLGIYLKKNAHSFRGKTPVKDRVQPPIASYSYGAMGGINTLGKALAGRSGWDISEGYTGCVGDNQMANNSSGFTAIPAGLYNSKKENFYVKNYMAGFWSTYHDTKSALVYTVTSSFGYISRYAHKLDYGFSVRYIKDI